MQGLYAYRSTDKATYRAWLLSITFLTVFAILVYVYNLNVGQISPTKTIYFDLGLWAAMALGSLS